MIFGFEVNSNAPKWPLEKGFSGFKVSKSENGFSPDCSPP